MPASVWHELSPTRHDQLQQVLDGAAPAEVAEQFRGKYLEAVAAQARRTGRRLRVAAADLDDGVQDAVAAYLDSLRGCRFRPPAGGQARAYRRYLCGMIRNRMTAFVRSAAASTRHLAALRDLVGGEPHGAADCKQARRPVSLSRELDNDEYREVLDASLEEWLEANRDGPLRVTYDAVVAVFADPGFDPEADSIPARVAARTGAAEATVNQHRLRIRKALRAVIARNVLRRLGP